MTKLLRWMVPGVVLLLPAFAQARVTSVGPGGFALELRAEVSASPDQAWRVMVQQVGRWWNDDHTWSGKASNMRIEPRALGCFCERWRDGDVAHMTVKMAEPGKALVMTGGLGPLLEMGASGALSWRIAPRKDGAGSVLTWRYVVSGYNEKGWEQMSGLVDQVLAEQFSRLQQRIAVH
jgi:uncharacterized protein YndB with AHSA1/START domain